jgi:type IV secretion system protein VirB9
LAEISRQPGVEPDLKVFVEVNDPGMLDAVASPKRLISARELESTRAELEQAKAETRQAQEDAQKAIDAGISQFVTNVRFAYRFEAGKRPFYVRAMYHDDRFTYIQARPEETPTIYEVRDKRPNLIEFSYKDGVYVVSKILDEGYLAIGRQRLPFKREE